MRDLSDKRGFAISLGLHLALLSALLVLRPMAGFAPLPEDSIEVELVGLDQAGAAMVGRPAASILPPSLPEPSLPDVPAAPQQAAPPTETTARLPVDSDAMITAPQLFSDGILASPRSRQAREALTTLDPAERIEQLCNLEAMSQIHAWKTEFEPDRVVAYAMAGIRLTKSVLQADGAAFRSRKQWYGLRFHCEVGAGGAKVAVFQFRVGEAIPRSEWAAHELPPEH